MYKDSFVEYTNDKNMVQIPYEVRHFLRIKENSPVEFYIDKTTGEVILRKYPKIIGKKLEDCIKFVETLYKFSGLKIIFTDFRRVLYAYDESLIGVEINYIHESIPEKVPAPYEFDVKCKFVSGYCYPILLNSEICFGIIIVPGGPIQQEAEDKAINLTISNIQSIIK